MQKKVVVISFGGSLIIPDDVDYKVIKDFKNVLLKKSNQLKFVVVCGGGSIARKYISAIEKETKNHKLISMAGIGATRMNARFMSYFFGRDAEEGIPHMKEQVKEFLRKDDIVFCGALEYKPHETSDGTSAELAVFLKSDLINMTNVDGLYSENPKTNKNAKFIPKESWENFEKRASKIKFKAGQHFVLDQNAAKTIKEHKVKTYIIGKNMKNLNNLLDGKKFIGTTISD